MEHGDAFTPETVDEQVKELMAASYADSDSPNAHVIRELQTYYEEKQRSTERVWQQLAQYIAEHDHDDALADQPARHPKQQDGSRPGKPDSPTSRHGRLSRLALIAAVLVAVLAVSSLLWILHSMQAAQIAQQTLQATQTGHPTGQTVQTQGVYFLKTDGIDKRDAQTGKLLWHVAHLFQNRINMNRTNPPAAVIGGTLYLLDDDTFDKIVALNTENGKVLWSRTFDVTRTAESIRPVLIDGLLYFSGSRVDTVSRNVMSGLDTVYAISPADGSIKATYKAPSSGWHDLVILNHTLYYTVDHPGGTDLYAAQLPGGKVLWHKPGSSAGMANANDGIAVATNGTQGELIASDIQTGTILWQQPVSAGIRVVAHAGDRAYASTYDGKVYAFDIHTGKQVWIRPFDTFDLQATPDTLYLSYTIHGTAHRGLVALSAKDGGTRWQSDIPNMSFFSGTFYIHLVNGVLYDVAINGDNIKVSDPSLYAVKADNGKILWHIPLKNQDDIDSIIGIIG
jgi:outer membrane protein assembly factor BamB